MKENFGMNYTSIFHFSADGRRDRHCFRHVSEAARPDVFLLNLQIRRVLSSRRIHSVRGRLTFNEDEQPMLLIYGVISQNLKK